MYIQSQDRQLLINLDKFHSLYVNDTTFCAARYDDGKKTVVVLGEYDSHEDAMNEFESLMDDMMNEGMSIYEVD